MCRLPAAALVLALATAACVAPGATVEDPTPSVGLQDPTFEPLPTDDPASPAAISPTPDATTPDPAVTSLPAPSPEQTPSRAPTPASTPTPTPMATTTGEDEAPPVEPIPLSGTLVDGTGDLRGLEASRAPGYADLREVVLTMRPDRGRITIAFAAPAPDAGEDDEILNVATYHDVTGDGQVDYEIWASMTANGWGTSWFDLRAGTARYAADDDVEVEVVDGVVVLTFPSSHLDGARSGQWLASSEWGTGLSISSGTSAVDDVPDDRSGAAWPD